MSFRNVIYKYQEAFQKAINNPYSEANYETVSKTIEFIKECTSNVEKKCIKEEVIFVIGPTGAGKSTLINYLNDKDSIRIANNDKLASINNIAIIGDESGSTTLYPNVYQISSSGINMVDCAGDFDSGGVLVEAINAKAKSIIAKNVKNVKLLFVCSQCSLESTGAYGKNFKEALDKNSIFLNDINYFKNSIGFVVTHANRKKDTMAFIEKAIKCILNQYGNLDRYKETLDYILKTKRIEIFSKPSSEEEVGEVYRPPIWNNDQCKKILNMISKLKNTKVPYENYFNVSTTSNIKNSIDKALDVIKCKIKFILQEVIKDNLKPKLLYAIELKSFVDYTKNLMILDKKQSIREYINLLQLNNYFKICHSKLNELNKLEGEMNYLNQFCNDGQGSNNDKTLEKWGIFSNSKFILNEIMDETYSILNKADFNFCKFENNKNIKTKGSCEVKSGEIKQLINKLIRAYRRHDEIINKKSFIKSEYYYEKEIEEFEKFNIIKYTEKQEIEYEHRAPKAPHDFILFFMSLGKGLDEGFHRGIPTGVEQGCKFFCEKDNVEMRKHVIDVEKEKKEPVFKKVIKRFFDENKYLEDLNENNMNIENLNLEIDRKLLELNRNYNYPEKIWSYYLRPITNMVMNSSSSFSDLREKIDNAMAEDVFNPCDEIEKKVLDIKLKWKKAEYEYYFFLNKNNVLDMNKYFNVEKSS